MAVRGCVRPAHAARGRRTTPASPRPAHLAPQDRPIGPACGVTMGIREDDDGEPRYVCLECGYPDEDDD